MQKSEPLFNIPRPVLVLAIFILAIQSLNNLLPSLYQQLFFNFAFYPETSFFPGVITYIFMHFDWTHVTMNSLMLVIFGTPISKRVGLLRFMALVYVTGIAGAMAQYAYQNNILLVGASAVTSGLFACCLRLQAFGQGDFAYAPLLPLNFILTSGQHLTIIAVWLITNYLFGSGLLDGTAQNIAWIAHVGGFLAGLLLFQVIDKKP
jgi:membrane associated rhomboid family serine protease